MRLCLPRWGRKGAVVDVVDAVAAPTAAAARGFVDLWREEAAAAAAEESGEAMSVSIVMLMTLPCDQARKFK